MSLTDDGCAYEGDTTPAPGRFDIEVENKTSHYFNFMLAALPAGKTVEDLRQAVERAKRPGIPVRGAGGARTGPHDKTVIHVNESSGRFVISCWVHNSAKGLSDFPPPPAALYVVPVELEVR